MELFNEETLDTIEGDIPGFRFAGTGDMNQIGDIIGVAIPIIFFFAGALLLIYLVYGGIQLMTGGGDEAKVASARGKITDALIGFVIVFTAFLIVQAFGIIFDLPQFGQIFGG